MPIDSLPTNQRAVLSLVLQKGRSYTEIATLLRIDDSAVRERANAALDALAPRDLAALPAARRLELCDYLLGQQPTAEAERTRDYLLQSAPARAWARGVIDELRPLARFELPEIPGEGAPAAEEEPPTVRRIGGDRLSAVPPQEPVSSKRGGAILLGGIVAIAAVILLAVALKGHSPSNKTFTNTAATGATGTTSSSSKVPKILYQVNLKPPRTRSKAEGFAYLLRQNNSVYMAIEATGLKPNSSGGVPAYAVWLYNSHKSAYRLGFARKVTADGKLGVVTPLKSNVADYRALILTQEYSANGKSPGPIVLAGPLPAHSLK